MDSTKSSKKCKNNYSVYVPPPARKAEYIAQQLLNNEEPKGITAPKVKRVKKKIFNKSELQSESEDNDTSSENKISDSDKIVDFLDITCHNDKESDLLNLSINSNVKIIAGDSFSDNNILEPKCSGFYTGDNLLDANQLVCESFSILNFNDKLKKGFNIDDNHNKSEELNRNFVRSDKDKNSYKVGVSIEENPLLSTNVESYTLDNQTFKHVWEKLYCDNLNVGTSTEAIKSKSECHKIHNVGKGRGNNLIRELTEDCIIEIYGFPVEFKTRDLLAIFSSYINRGFQIRWVDDTHALGIFSSPVTAYEVLNTDLPSVNTRSLNEAFHLSKEKAKQLMPPPPPPRPKTCSASARRLVSGALGIKPVFTKAEIEAEKEMLKMAREQRNLAVKQREAA